MPGDSGDVGDRGDDLLEPQQPPYNEVLACLLWGLNQWTEKSGALGAQKLYAYNVLGGATAPPETPLLRAGYETDILYF